MSLQLALFAVLEVGRGPEQTAAVGASVFFAVAATLFLGCTAALLLPLFSPDRPLRRWAALLATGFASGALWVVAWHFAHYGEWPYTGVEELSTLLFSGAGASAALVIPVLFWQQSLPQTAQDRPRLLLRALLVPLLAVGLAFAGERAAFAFHQWQFRDLTSVAQGFFHAAAGGDSTRLAALSSGPEPLEFVRQAHRQEPEIFQRVAAQKLQVEWLAFRSDTLALAQYRFPFLEDALSTWGEPKLQVRYVRANSHWQISWLGIGH